jgi:hypothetical protein
MKVNHRKLGREKALGLAHIDDGLIEIDSRLKGKEKLIIFIHEALHLVNPTHSESKIIKDSTKIGNMLWKQGYRLVEK